jgi:hypothetical protein
MEFPIASSERSVEGVRRPERIRETGIDRAIRLGRIDEGGGGALDASLIRGMIGTAGRDDPAIGIGTDRLRGFVNRAINGRAEAGQVPGLRGDG